MVWQGGAIDVSAAEAAAGALAEAAAGSVLEANGEELVVARLRGLPWSFNAVEVRRRTLTQRRWPLGGGLVLLTVLVCSARYRGGALCGSTSCREVTAGRCRSRASRAGAGGGRGGGGDEPRSHARGPMPHFLCHISYAAVLVRSATSWPRWE